MASEKLRYLLARRGAEPPLELGQVAPCLSRLPPEDLAQIIVSAGAYDDVVRRVMFLHAVFAVVESHSPEKLAQTVRFALDLQGLDIPYNRSGAYGQVPHAVHTILEALARRGDKQLALSLCEIAIQKGAEGAESLQDGHSWDMALDDLCAWRDAQRG